MAWGCLLGIGHLCLPIVCQVLGSNNLSFQFFSLWSTWSLTKELHTKSPSVFACGLWVTNRTCYSWALTFWTPLSLGEAQQHCWCLCHPQSHFSLFRKGRTCYQLSNSWKPSFFVLSLSFQSKLVVFLVEQHFQNCCGPPEYVKTIHDLVWGEQIKTDVTGSHL